MGADLPPEGIQVRGGGLTGDSLIARVVPDVAGLDRSFDYLVPETLTTTARVGAKVRVNLNGRRVGGWIIAILSESSDGSQTSPVELKPLLSVQGVGVSADLVGLAEWAANRWCGPTRSVLVSASAPRVRDLPGRPQHRLWVPAAGTRSPTGSTQSEHPRRDMTPGAIPRLVCAAPQDPVISIALDAAAEGPVLVLCPTTEMATRGGAWLRRHGAVVAEHPAEWSRAAGGVDVVIGARSAVWSPVPGLRTILVVDEHETSYQEERVPTWDAVDVAVERGVHCGATVILSSSTPSLRRVDELLDGRISPAESNDPLNGGRWPVCSTVDLLSVEQTGHVASSLLSAELLALCRDRSSRTAVILNARDESIGVRCRDCGQRAVCESCAGPVRSAATRGLLCDRCTRTVAALCGACGGTRLAPLRIGVRALAEQLRRATQRQVAVVTGKDTEVPGGTDLVVGTEAALHRVHPLDNVVLADVDGMLQSSKLGARERLWGLIVRALRVVGEGGRVVVQTRDTHHDLIESVGRTRHEGSGAYLDWARTEVLRRRALFLPPCVPSAVVRMSAGASDAGLWSLPDGVRRAAVEDGQLLCAPDREALIRAVTVIREIDPRGRVAVDLRDL